MMIFLDTNIVVYLIETTSAFHPRALAYCTAIRTAGHSFAVSDLVRMECRVGPMLRCNQRLLDDFDAFFASAGVGVLPLTAAVCDRATLLRVAFNLKTADALQLAAAIVHGCDRFLTADARLQRCTDIPVDLLP